MAEDYSLALWFAFLLVIKMCQGLKLLRRASRLHCKDILTVVTMFVLVISLLKKADSKRYASAKIYHSILTGSIFAIGFTLHLLSK